MVNDNLVLRVFQCHANQFIAGTIRLFGQGILKIYNGFIYANGEHHRLSAFFNMQFISHIISPPDISMDFILIAWYI